MTGIAQQLACAARKSPCSPIQEKKLAIKPKLFCDDKGRVMINYLTVFDHEIDGETRQIGVISYFREPAWRGDPRDCPSDLDFYGYVETDYHVLDENGEYRAELQESGDTDQVIDAIKEAMGDA